MEITAVQFGRIEAACAAKNLTNSIAAVAPSVALGHLEKCTQWLKPIIRLPI